ncbi:NAD-dependent epimerase/dehydratase family protein [Rhodovulum adriaticum]|nr:NAD(P)-dependent oxidoreductase [Rhodovulum adriaticum]
MLLTGPTSTAGQYILETLMTTDHDVRVLALADSMHRVRFRDRIEMVPGDVLDPVSLAEAARGVDLVFHTALVSPTPTLWADTLDAVNVTGTRNLIAACAGSARRMVMVTSNNIYGLHRSPAMWPLLDDDPRHAHGNPTQVAESESLIAAEDALMDAGATGKLDYAILRPTVIAGRKCPAIETMVSTVLRNQPAQIEMQRRLWDVMQWTHGKDLARAALLVAEDDRARNQCFLVAGEEPITLYDIQAMVWDILNVGRTDNPVTELASRNNIGLVKREPRKLKALGWRAEIPVRDCIEEVLGRLDFASSESIRLPAYMLED